MPPTTSTRRTGTLAARVAGAGAAATAMLLLSAAHLAPPIHGSPITGPKPPSEEQPRHLARVERVRWVDAHRVIELSVRDGRACRPIVTDEQSTAPARVEVALLRPAGRGCELHERWYVFRLAPPTVMEPGQAVDVHVDDDRLALSRYST